MVQWRVEAGDGTVFVFVYVFVFFPGSQYKRPGKKNGLMKDLF